MSKATLAELENRDEFISRHLNTNQADVDALLAEVGASSLDDLTAQIVPESILREPFLKMGDAIPEREALANLKAMAQENQVFTSYIGMGYHDMTLPNVILRNVLENPGWYTAYTPYQPEIAQGRLESILNYQHMVIDMTGMELANASLLDEATAAAEAMALIKRVVRKNKSNTFFVDENVLPQTIDVLKTRAEGFGWDLHIGPAVDALNVECFGALFQYPAIDGTVVDLEEIIKILHEQNALSAVATDLMALALLKSPGEMGADVVLGNSQRFGVPMGFGGPHAAF
ncbi:glycine dehydrogenase (aminomethyl-transferring), partial [Bermanella sp. 47_1433_sub80_T6]